MELKRWNGQVTVNVRTLEKWLGYLLTTRVEKQWKSLTGAGIKTYGDDFHVGGIQLGNVWIGVQPPLRHIRRSYAVNV